MNQWPELSSYALQPNEIHAKKSMGEEEEEISVYCDRNVLHETQPI